MEQKEDLAAKPSRDGEKTKAIIDIKEEWPWYQRLAGNVINFSGVFIWLGVTIFLLYVFGLNPELVGYRNALLNIIVPAVSYGILSLVAGLSLISWLFPYFNYRRIMRSGSPEEKAACMQFYAAIAIALAIIIAGVV